MVCIDMEFFESMHVGDCIVGGGSDAHSSTTCSEEVTTTEGEIVALEYELKWFDEGGICRAPGRSFQGF